MGTPGHDEQSYFRYLPVGRTDELRQLYVTTVGRITIGPGESCPYEADRHPPGYTLNWSAGRVLNEFQFVYVTLRCRWVSILPWRDNRIPGHRSSAHSRGTALVPAGLRYGLE